MSSGEKGRVVARHWLRKLREKGMNLTNDLYRKTDTQLEGSTELQKEDQWLRLKWCYEWRSVSASAIL